MPFDALAYVFGRNAMYWYRIYLSLGRASIVGTTIKNPQKLPQHLVADEKHTWLRGSRVYLPTTVAKGCFLGVGFTSSASAEALTAGYREFQTEANLLNPNYAPVTVNTDAWQYFSVNKLIIWFSYGEIGFWGLREKLWSIPQVPTSPLPYSYP